MIRRKTTTALGAMRRNAIAWLALFVALGGTGYAAATIGPGDIRDDAVRARHIADGQVGTAAIRDDAVLNRDIRNGQVRTADLAGNAVTTGRIRNGHVRAPDLARDAVSSSRVRDGSLTPADLEPLPAVRVNVTPELFASGEKKVIGWSTFNTDFDQGSMHSGGSRLVAPRDGLYAVDAQVEWRRDDTLSGATITLDKNQNGTCAGRTRDRTRPARDVVTNARPNANLTNDINTLVALEAGDYLELCALQSSGEDQLIEFGGFTWVTMRFVGRLGEQP